MGLSVDLTSFDQDTLSIAFARAPLLMTISEGADGRYVDVNEAFVRVTGFAREVALGRSSVELGMITQTTRARLLAEIDAHGRVPEQEIEVRRADGGLVFCRYSGELIEVGGRTLLLSVATNISEVREAEARLFESEARFRMLFDHMLQSVVVFAPLEDGADFEIVGVNQAMLELTSRSRTALLHLRASALYDDAQVEGHLELFRRVWRTGSAEVMDVHPHHGNLFDGWFRHSAFRLPSMHVVVVTEDVTREHAARSELDLVRLAVEHAAESVLVTDKNGTIEYVNPAFEAVTGYSRAEVLGKNPRILKSGRHSSVFYAQMWGVLTRGEVWRGRLENRVKDGRILTEEAVISPVRDARGELVNFVAVKRDVSEEQRLEAELRQAQKMEAIGQLTGGVAHDFNNLLQVISGALEFASLDLAPNHPARAEIEDALSATESAGRLAGQLLLFARRQTMKMAEVLLDDVVTDLSRMVKRVLGERVDLQFECRSEGQLVFADRGMLEQCVINLCLNARDAMPSGGRIRVATRVVGLQSSDLWQPWATAGRYVVLSVQDEGVGIATDLQERVFEPFFTTKSAGHGTGLGLSTVYGIVKQHQGLVRVDSELGRGSTFELFWPVRPADEASGPVRVESGALGGDETILIAEDERPVRDITRRMLERAGYRVLTAENGAVAVSSFEANMAQIDLVVLDAVMPEVGGGEALTRIRRLRPEVAVLFATGYGERELSEEALAQPRVSLIRKPFVRAELLRAVRGALER